MHVRVSLDFHNAKLYVCYYPPYFLENNSRTYPRYLLIPLRIRDINLTKIRLYYYTRLPNFIRMGRLDKNIFVNYREHVRALRIGRIKVSYC